MKKIVAIFFSFLALYCLFFLPFPLTSSYPGNTDTYAAITFSNIYLNELKEFFFGESIGRSLFPHSISFSSGETAFGTGSLFIIFKLMGLNDLWAYYLFLSLLFSLSSFALFLFLGSMNFGYLVAFGLSLIFHLTNFSLGNLDGPHTVFFFFTFLSFFFLSNYFKKSQISYLYISALLSGLQAYFSIYIFLIQIVIFPFLILALGKGKWQMMKGHRIHIFTSLIVSILILSPFIKSYALKGLKNDVINPWNAKAIAELHSLNPEDLFRKIPGNLYSKEGTIPTREKFVHELKIYQKEGYAPYAGNFIFRNRLNVDGPRPPSQRNIGDLLQYQHTLVLFPFIRRCAFLGFTLWIMAFIGFFICSKRERWVWVSMGLIGFLFSLGPLIKFGQWVIPAPLFPLYEVSDFFKFIRIPSRAFFVTQLALLILAGKALMKACEKRTNAFLLPFYVSFILLENIPLTYFKFQGPVIPDQSYLNFFKDKNEKVILDLPSDMGLSFNGDDEDFFPYSRETIYMNWQTYHKQNSLNGVHGYIPKTRIQVDHLAKSLPLEDSLNKLRKNFKVDYLIYHPKMVFYRSEKDLKDQLLSSPLLNLDFSNDQVLIFSFKNGVPNES